MSTHLVQGTVNGLLTDTYFYGFFFIYPTISLTGLMLRHCWGEIRVGMLPLSILIVFRTLSCPMDMQLSYMDATVGDVKCVRGAYLFIEGDGGLVVDYTEF